MSSDTNTKKSLKDYEPKSVQSKLDEKSEELREKRTRKLEEKRGQYDNDEFVIEMPSELMNITIRSQQPAPKITPGNSEPLSDEDSKELTSRMKSYCNALGDQYLKAQVKLLQYADQQVDPKTFEMRTFRVDDKLYGRKKKFYTIVCDEKHSDKVWTHTHAFIDVLNGDVYKPNNRSPSKRPVHNLLNDESYQWVIRNCTWTGSELYKSTASRDWALAE